MWVGYIRVSQVAGRSGESFRSPSDQAESIRGYAKARGWSVKVLPPELDLSGAKRERPIFQEALVGIESGRFEGMIVYSLSRAARNARHSLEIRELVEGVGGRVFSATENLDTTTPEGRMQWTIRAAIDENVVDTHRANFARAVAGATARGRWQRRQVPFGYRKDPATGRLTPDVNARKVRKAYTDRSGRRSVSSIAEGLPLTRSGVARMLANRVYLGELHVAGNVNREAHPAIIDLATFEAVQELRSARPARGNRGVSLLAGLVRCEGCSHAMARNFTGPHGGTYRCAGKHHAGRCQRPAGITGRILDQYVEAVARRELERLRVRSTQRTDDIDQLRDDLTKAEAELAHYLEATAAAGVGVEAFAAAARKREDAVRDARDALAMRETVTPLTAVFASGVEAFDALDVERKNHVLRGLFDCVVVRRVGRGRKVDVAERVRIFAAGSLPEFRYRGGATPLPVVAFDFPNVDDERLIGECRTEGGGQSTGG